MRKVTSVMSTAGFFSHQSCFCNESGGVHHVSFFRCSNGESASYLSQNGQALSQAFCGSIDSRVFPHYAANVVCRYLSSTAISQRRRIPIGPTRNSCHLRKTYHVAG